MSEQEGWSDKLNQYTYVVWLLSGRNRLRLPNTTICDVPSASGSVLDITICYSEIAYRSVLEGLARKDLKPTLEIARNLGMYYSEEENGAVLLRIIGLGWNFSHRRERSNEPWHVFCNYERIEVPFMTEDRPFVFTVPVQCAHCGVHSIVDPCPRCGAPMKGSI